MCLSRRLADQMYQLSDGTLLFSEGSVLESETGLRIQSSKDELHFQTWPKGRFRSSTAKKEMRDCDQDQGIDLEREQAHDREHDQDSGQDLFDYWTVDTQKKEIQNLANQVSAYQAGTAQVEELIQVPFSIMIRRVTFRI